MAAFFIREVLIQCRNLSVKLSSKGGMDTGLGEAQPILTALGGQDSTRDTRDSLGDTRDSQGFALCDLESLFKGPNLSLALIVLMGRKRLVQVHSWRALQCLSEKIMKRESPFFERSLVCHRGRIMGCKWGGRIPFGDCTNSEQGVGLWFSNGGTTSNKTPLLIAEGRVSEIQVNSVSHRKQLGKKQCLCGSSCECGQESSELTALQEAAPASYQLLSCCLKTGLLLAILLSFKLELV